MEENKILKEEFIMLEIIAGVAIGLVVGQAVLACVGYALLNSKWFINFYAKKVTEMTGSMQKEFEDAFKKIGL